jgi:predicted GNAT family N-acyltransferase
MFSLHRTVTRYTQLIPYLRLEACNNREGADCYNLGNVLVRNSGRKDQLGTHIPLN